MSVSNHGPLAARPRPTLAPATGLSWPCLVWEGSCSQREPERPRSGTSCKDRAMTHRCAILDDYQDVALKYADWSKVTPDVEVKVFNQPFKSADEVVRALKGFDIVAMMRERTPFPRTTIEALPDLKLLITTGAANKSIDVAAAHERGIAVAATGTFGNPTTGVTCGLILELTRRIGFEN